MLIPEHKIQEVLDRADIVAVVSRYVELKKAGMQVTEIAPAELARLRDKVRPVVDKHSAKIGAETVQSVMAELARLRKGAPAK